MLQRINYNLSFHFYQNRSYPLDFLIILKKHFNAAFQEHFSIITQSSNHHDLYRFVEKVLLNYESTFLEFEKQYMKQPQF